MKIFNLEIQLIFKTNTRLGFHIKNRTTVWFYFDFPAFFFNFSYFLQLDLLKG